MILLREGYLCSQNWWQLTQWLWPHYSCYDITRILKILCIFLIIEESIWKSPARNHLMKDIILTDWLWSLCKSLFFYSFWYLPSRILNWAGPLLAFWLEEIYLTFKRLFLHLWTSMIVSISVLFWGLHDIAFLVKRNI